MASDVVNIAVASVGAVVTIAGWSISYFLTKRREDRTRRLALVLVQIERQIGELYGPLLSLIEQVFATWEAREKIIRKSNLEDAERVRKFIQKSHFFPLHMRIKEILSSKLYLVEGGEIPKSFQIYLEHATQQIIRRELESELSLTYGDIEYVAWPKNFEADVRKGLEGLMDHYNRCLNDIDPRAAFRISRSEARGG